MMDDTREATDGEGVDDAELVRYLDGELDGPSRDLLESRLRASPEAAARLATLAGRSGRLGSALAELDPTFQRTQKSEHAIASGLPGARRSGWIRRPATMRAAAAAVVMLGLTLSVPPARAWMIEGTRRLAEAIGLTSPPVAPSVPEELDLPELTGPDASFDFDVTNTTFDVEAASSAGVLVVRLGEGGRGRADVTDPGQSSLVVLTSGIRIEGTAAPGSTFTVSLPASVRIVRVRVGAGEPTSYPMPSVGSEVRIPLAGG